MAITPVTSATVTPSNIEKKDNNNDLAKAIEKNSETAKTCAYVALGTSIATFLPLSLIALKANQMSKAAQKVSDAAEPILKHVDEAVVGVGQTLREGVGEIAAVAAEKLDGVELKPLVNKAGEFVDAAKAKLTEVGVKPLVEKAKEGIEKLNIEFSPEKFNG